MVVVLLRGKGFRFRRPHLRRLAHAFLEGCRGASGQAGGVAPAACKRLFHHFLNVPGNRHAFAVYVPAFISHRDDDVKGGVHCLMGLPDGGNGFLLCHPAHLDVVDIDARINPVVVYFFPVQVKSVLLFAVQADQVSVGKGQVRQKAVPDPRQLRQHGDADRRQNQQADHRRGCPGSAVLLPPAVFRPLVPARNRMLKPVEIVKNRRRRTEAVVLLVGSKIAAPFLLFLFLPAVIRIPFLQALVPSQRFFPGQ